MPTTKKLLLLGIILTRTLQHSTSPKHQPHAVRKLLLIHVGEINLPHFAGDVIFPGLRGILAGWQSQQLGRHRGWRVGIQTSSSVSARHNQPSESIFMNLRFQSIVSGSCTLMGPA